MKKWIWMVLAALVIIGFFYYILSNNSQDKTVKLKTASVKRGDLKLTVAATGVVKPYVEVEVKSKAGGEIVSFSFEEGDLLSKGRVVVMLDTETEQSRVNQAHADLLIAEARLEKAEITLKDTKIRLKRKKSLFENELISQEAYDDAIIASEKAASDVKIADAERIRAREALRESKDRLRDTRIKAPLTGTILKKYVERGQVISSTMSSASEGTLLFTMADLNKIYVGALVDETDIGTIRPAQNVSITVDAYPGNIFQGQVLRIAPKGRTESTVTIFDVTIEVADQNKTLLKPMMTANVEILTDLREDVLLIPAEAVRVRKKENGVFRLTGDEPEWTAIRLGTSNGIHTEVLDGIQEGDEVVLSGIEQRQQKEERSRNLRRSFRFFGRKK